jgi:DNA-binding Lrp family transcriptional regulator
MSKVLELLLDGERLSTAQMSEILNLSEAEIEKELKRLKEKKIFLGWRPVLNPAAIDKEEVRAVIQVKITPEREGGFDRLAIRLSRFDEVDSCHLMSGGGYDLLIFISGKNLRSVANFVSEKLATVEGVVSTGTHFLLRTYKEQGHLLLPDEVNPDKPTISP